MGFIDLDVHEIWLFFGLTIYIRLKERERERATRCLCQGLEFFSSNKELKCLLQGYVDMVMRSETLIAKSTTAAGPTTPF